jgi:hypothetical protein
MDYSKTLSEYSLKIRYFNYSKRTEEMYLHYTLKFLNCVGKNIQHFTSSDFENYLLCYNFTSISQQKFERELQQWLLFNPFI